MRRVVKGIIFKPLVAPKDFASRHNGWRAKHAKLPCSVGFLFQPLFNLWRCGPRQNVSCWVSKIEKNLLDSRYQSAGLARNVSRIAPKPARSFTQGASGRPIKVPPIAPTTISARATAEGRTFLLPPSPHPYPTGSASSRTATPSSSRPGER
jgi:hypothetical protein